MNSKNYFILEDPANLPKLNAMKMLYVKTVLDLHGGNKSRAAEVLGTSLRSLRNWLNDGEGCEPGRHCNETHRCKRHLQ